MNMEIIRITKTQFFYLMDFFHSTGVSEADQSAKHDGIWSLVEPLFWLFSGYSPLLGALKPEPPSLFFVPSTNCERKQGDSLRRVRLEYTVTHLEILKLALARGIEQANYLRRGTTFSYHLRSYSRTIHAL